jgi:hypothetical protein
MFFFQKFPMVERIDAQPTCGFTGQYLRVRVLSRSSSCCYTFISIIQEHKSLRELKISFAQGNPRTYDTLLRNIKVTQNLSFRISYSEEFASVAFLCACLCLLLCLKGNKSLAVLHLHEENYKSELSGSFFSALAYGIANHPSLTDLMLPALDPNEQMLASLRVRVVSVFTHEKVPAWCHARSLLV